MISTIFMNIIQTHIRKPLLDLAIILKVIHASLCLSLINSHLKRMQANHRDLTWNDQFQV